MGHDDGIEWMWAISYFYPCRGALRERVSEYIRRIHSVNTKRSLDGNLLMCDVSLRLVDLTARLVSRLENGKTFWECWKELETPSSRPETAMDCCSDEHLPR